MISLVTLAVLAAPTTGLVLSTEVGKPGTVVASQHLDSLEQELITAKFAVRRLEAADCKGDRDCLLANARKASVPALIAVSIAWGKKQTTLDLEGLRVSDGATVAQLTFTLAARLGDAERVKVKSFLEQLSEAVSDAPTKGVTLTPPPVIDVPPLAVATRSRVPEIATGAGAIATGVAAAVLLGVAGGTNGQLNATPDPSPLTHAQAQELANQANGQYTASLALGLSAAALAAVTVVLFLRE
ncbi:MAG: hypothetical protein JNM17_25225 [Archangium sp.]|nr:hypothetical protein [Archangium sp.]